MRISDIITSEYSDFLSYCSSSGKLFVSDLTNVDFVAFRTMSGQTREYIKTIKTMLYNPVFVLRNNKKPNSVSTHANGEIVISAGGTKCKTNEVNLGETVDANKTANKTIYKGEIREENGSIINCMSSCSNSSEISKYINDKHDVVKVVENKGTSSSEQQTESFSSKKTPSESQYTLAHIFNVDASLFEDVGIIVLNLGMRSSNCLNRENIITVADVLSKTVDQLRAIQNIGVKSVHEILQKTKEYISSLGSDIGDLSMSFQRNQNKKGNINLDPKIKTAVEAILLGDEYSFENLEENIKKHIEKLKEAVKVVGAEICLEAYLNPDYSAVICMALSEFAAPYIYYHSAKKEAVHRINCLPEYIQQLNVGPFIRAYSAKTGDRIFHLLQECNDNTKVKNILSLFEKIPNEENIITFAAEINRFLGWLSFDISALIATITENIRNIFSVKSERSLEVFVLRSKGKTLEEVGNFYGVTRERIRQIEKKAHKIFWEVYKQQKYDLIMLVYALRNGDNILYYQELKDIVGDEFATVLWTCIKHKTNHDFYFYSKLIDAIVIKENDTENISDDILLSKIKNSLASMPDVIENCNKEEMLANLADNISVPAEILNNVFDNTYNRVNSFYCRGRMTVAYMYEYVLKNRFRAGYKIADNYEGERFKRYMTELFGERAEAVTTRAIDAKVAEIGVLCDRGKYIHPDYMQVDTMLIDAINDYIETFPRSLLSYGEIFEALKSELEGSQITNKYLLQGALKKYGCRFDTGRDFVRKARYVTFLDELEAFVEKRGVVHKSEIFAEFTSLSDATLGQVVGKSTEVFNIDGGYYIHADQFDIRPKDYDLIREYLKKSCADIPVNIRTIYEKFAEKFPEFMYRNNFDDRNKLFAALNYMFREEFSFSKPYIAKLGVGDITNRSVILRHIENYDTIEIEDLIDICRENGIRYIAPANLCQSLAPDYIRISGTTLMKRELTGITDEIIDQTVEIIKDLLTVNDYIVGSKAIDFLWFPQINVDWNVFLLENLIIQSKKIGVIYMSGDSLKHPNAIYVSDAYRKNTLESFLVKFLSDEVHKGSFTSKAEMRDWLIEEGFIESKLPHFLESTKYFYVNETGVHCKGE